MELCFSCGMPMINGICPECGYQYPFAFQCQYINGTTCRVTKKLCNRSEKYHKCKTWQDNS